MTPFELNRYVHGVHGLGKLSDFFLFFVAVYELYSAFFFLVLCLTLIVPSVLFCFVHHDRGGDCCA